MEAIIGIGILLFMLGLVVIIWVAAFPGTKISNAMAYFAIACICFGIILTPVGFGLWLIFG